MTKLDDILETYWKDRYDGFDDSITDTKRQIKSLMHTIISSQPYQKQGSMQMIGAIELLKEIEAL